MKTVTELWQQSQNDAEGMRLGYTTQQHYFAELVRADEREANAKVCDELQQQWRPAGECADAIRGREAREHTLPVQPVQEPTHVVSAVIVKNIPASVYSNIQNKLHFVTAPNSEDAHGIISQMIKKHFPEHQLHSITSSIIQTCKT